MNTKKQFFKYVSFSMLSAIGMSCYCLADTIFIANGVGINGLTALNLVMPIYNIIFAIGFLLGIGGATRYSILNAQKKEKEASDYYSYSLTLGIILSLPIMVIGYIFSNKIVMMLGADQTILPTASLYLKSFILFTPFFILSQIFCAFIRNDFNPKLASIASFTGTIFNIVFDYILVFPFKLGMMGAALATGFSPIVTILICSFHFISKKNHFHLKKIKYSIKPIIQIIQTGLPSFITELSSGLVIFTFNYVILSISGNVAVASYGILSNLAVFVIGFYNGISQGIQPLLSHHYGAGKLDKMKEYLKLAISTSFIISIIMMSFMLLFPQQIVDVFNSDNNKIMANIAIEALPIYFSSFFFIGLSLIFISYFTSTNQVKSSSLISILRGGVIIIPILFIFSYLFHIIGVWLAYPVSELIILIIGIILIKNQTLITKKY